VLFGLLSLFVVPAPGARTAVEVSGTLVSVSQPQLGYGDMGIVLEDGRRYYVNRADEVEYFAWEEMLADVRAGDTIYLTVVPPLAWRLMGVEPGRPLPVAGIRTAREVYMDPAISAETWTAQTVFSRMAGSSLLVLALCVLPEFLRLLRHRPPATAVGLWAK
jgi:hypothetical protein